MIFISAWFFASWAEALPKPRRDMNDLKVAFSHYRVEYDSWPEIEALKNSESKPVPIRGKLLQALLGEVSELNPKGISFVRFRQAAQGVSGLAFEGDTIALHDAWGNCYWLMVDSNHDNRIPNPELFSDAITDPRIKLRAPKLISASVCLFSSGPDKDPKTWLDNACSWR